MQDCLGAIPICTEIYEEKNAPEGSGNYTNEIFGSNDGGLCCMDDERNSIWYTFTVNKDGKFGFLLTPNDPDDDYDWALFDITHASCSDIRRDISLQVSCNAAGGDSCNGLTGADGQTSFANQGGGCSFYPPDVHGGFSAHNDLIPVQKGNTYVLVVSNWTGSTNGYVIDFSPSEDLGIFDNDPPLVAEITTPQDCEVGTFKLEFSENIQLPSIRNDNFILHGPFQDHQVTVNSFAHSIKGDYSKVFDLHFIPAIIEPGTYKLEMLIDGKSDILDLCGNPLQNANEIEFTISETPLSPPPIPGDTLLCEGTILHLDVSHPKAIAYQWSDGSLLPAIDIDQAGIYTVEIENECGAVESEIRVEFANCDSCAIYVPNAFTPNGDGINDILQVFSDCELSDFSFSIYNRWGGMIHYSEDQNNCWNGKVQGGTDLSDTFVYLLRYKVQELGAVFYREVAGSFSLIR